MKVLLTVAAWGRNYAELLAQYSLASLLSPNNLPRLGREHDITCHIVTTAADYEWLRQQPSVIVLERHCTIHWDLMEGHGYSPDTVPAGLDDRKYPFLSLLQNLAFAQSRDHDAIVFNYADFIWADGSLMNAVEMLKENVDAVLSFCLPVDQTSGIAALDKSRAGKDDILNLPQRQLARIAIDYLHKEARLRIWNAAEFTRSPSYVLWPVGSDGLVIRAYHQTVLALKVQHSDPQFFEGILRGSLDDYFSSRVGRSGRAVHAADSDAVMAFSLYHTNINSVARDMTSRESLMRILGLTASEEQRRFVEIPIRVKTDFSDPDAWNEIERQSFAELEDIHRAVPFDPEAYERFHEERGNLADSLRPRTKLELIYRRYAPIFIQSPLGMWIRRVAGGPARKLRLDVERALIKRGKSRQSR